MSLSCNSNFQSLYNDGEREGTPPSKKRTVINAFAVRENGGNGGFDPPEGVVGGGDGGGGIGRRKEADISGFDDEELFMEENSLYVDSDASEFASENAADSSSSFIGGGGGSFVNGGSNGGRLFINGDGGSPVSTVVDGKNVFFVHDVADGGGGGGVVGAKLDAGSRKRKDLMIQMASATGRAKTKETTPRQRAPGYRAIKPAARYSPDHEISFSMPSMIAAAKLPPKGNGTFIYEKQT